MKLSSRNRINILIVSALSSLSYSSSFLTSTTSTTTTTTSTIRTRSCSRRTNNKSSSLTNTIAKTHCRLHHHDGREPQAFLTSLSSSTTSLNNGGNDLNTNSYSSSTTVLSPLESSTRSGGASHSSSSHENFDYLSHWYPVSWTNDLQLDKPTKVTVFDVDYVVAKIKNESSGEEEVIAMVDECPHKMAALSEGRITKSGKSFQCAYHGWTFDSKTGECIDIPQVAPSITENSSRTSSSCSNKVPTTRSKKRRSGMDLKANGVAVPAMIVQGIVWIFPGGGLEKALLAPPPPEIPDLEKDGFRTTTRVVRDFPIDWTILIENIMDADHGLFAHQATGFDLYTASNTNLQTVEETSINNGKGWSITSKVDATYELLHRNEEEEISITGTKKKRKFAMKKGEKPKSAVVTFVAPSLIYMARRNDDNESSFISTFFITPTGTGKSRFMAGSVSKTPKWINIPRWMAHIFINNFLDQDTYLLATQQRHVLALESQLNIEVAQRGTHNDKEEDTTIVHETIPVRKQLYKYRSPTEKLGSKVGNWLDATVSRVPNRTIAITALGGYKNALEKLSMTRNKALDRYTQHTSVCTDSMQVVKNCQTIRKASKLLAFLPIFFRLLVSFGTNAGGGGFGGGSGVSSIFHSWLLKVNRNLSSTSVLLIWVLSAAASYLCTKVEKEFNFKYTEEYRDKDMDNIPSVWMDRM